MKKSDKDKIKIFASELCDKDLEEKYYDAVYDCLGSQTDAMYELGYDIRDIQEREKYEKYLGEKADILEELCLKRGIELWSS